MERAVDVFLAVLNASTPPPPPFPRGSEKQAEAEVRADHGIEQGNHATQALLKSYVED